MYARKFRCRNTSDKKIDKKENKKSKSEKNFSAIKLTEKDLVEAGNVVGQDFTGLLADNEKDPDDQKKSS